MVVGVVVSWSVLVGVVVSWSVLVGVVVVVVGGTVITFVGLIPTPTVIAIIVALSVIIPPLIAINIPVLSS